MKKGLAVILALFMVLSFAGCGSKSQTDSTNEAEKVTVEETPIDNNENEDNSKSETSAGAADYNEDVAKSLKAFLECLGSTKSEPGTEAWASELVDAEMMCAMNLMDAFGRCSGEDIPSELIDTVFEECKTEWTDSQVKKLATNFVVMSDYLSKSELLMGFNVNQFLSDVSNNFSELLK